MSNNEYNQKFISDIAIPYFLGAVDKNFISVMYDLEGKIIIATNEHAKLFGYSSWSEIKGKTLADLYPHEDYSSFIDKLSSLREKVISDKKSITHLLYLPFNSNSFEMMLSYHFPIISPRGDVVASRAIIKRLNMVNTSIRINNYLKSLAKNSNKNGKAYKLSSRQEEILFLLTIGFSQEQTAQHLGITRGTIAKVISEEICPTFGITGSNSKLLIKEVISNNFFNNIPHKVMKPIVIEVDDSFETKYYFNI